MEQSDDSTYSRNLLVLVSIANGYFKLEVKSEIQTNNLAINGIKRYLKPPLTLQIV